MSAFLSKYNTARHIFIPLIKAGSNNHAVSADWTPAAGDVKISKDGGAAANVTNLPTAIAMGNSTIWDFSLTATEMSAAQVNVTVADSATKAVEDDGFIIETYGNASAQHVFDLSQATPAVNVTQLNGTTQTAGDIFGTRAEPGQGAPAATTSIFAKIDYLFKAWRNKTTQTATTYSLFADDTTTVDQKATVSDDLTTFTRGEVGTGP